MKVTWVLFVLVVAPIVVAFLAGYYLHLEDTFLAKRSTNLDEGEHINAQRLLVGLVNAVQRKSAHLQEAERRPPLRVALGYNANLDLVARATEVVRSIVGEAPQQDVEELKPQPHAKISSLVAFQQALAHFFTQGSAAERWMEDKREFQQVVAAASSSPTAIFSPGGNAALMAQRFAAEGNVVLLGGPVGSRLASLLDSRISYPSSSSRSSSAVDGDDEVHLILEYSKGELWPTSSSSMKAPRANRFILVHDERNSMLSGLEELHAALPDFHPDLLVLAGLHLLSDGEEKENDSTEERSKEEKEVDKGILRLHKVAEEMKELASRRNKFATMTERPAIHLELASIADSRFLSRLAALLLPTWVDSLGLNEQELGSLLFALSSSTSASNALLQPSPPSLSAFVSPDVQTVVDGIHSLFRWIQAEQQMRRSKNSEVEEEEEVGLTRIHFHSLHFHIVAIRKLPQHHCKEVVDEQEKKQKKECTLWKNGGEASVAAGSLAASKQACGVDLDDAQSLQAAHVLLPPQSVKPLRGSSSHEIQVNGSLGVTSWSDGGIEFYLAPVLVCKHPSKTVGLGDAISTMGLVRALS
ncbi:ADP-dependent glucokinase [Balamuthia mandrillaris]